MAVATEAELCNLALARIGEREYIDNLDEDTVPAQACKVHYATARDAVLASFPWRFATHRAALALVANATRDGWLYVYALPTGLLEAQRIWAGRGVTPELRIPFELEGDATVGRVLLTDQPSAVLVYTARVEAVTRFPPLFIDTLAWRLATELALALPVKPNIAAVMEAKYKAALAGAAAQELRQSQEDAPPEAESIRVR